MIVRVCKMVEDMLKMDSKDIEQVQSVNNESETKVDAMVKSATNAYLISTYTLVSLWVIWQSPFTMCFIWPFLTDCMSLNDDRVYRYRTTINDIKFVDPLMRELFDNNVWSVRRYCDDRGKFIKLGIRLGHRWANMHAYYSLSRWLQDHHVKMDYLPPTKKQRL